uniref:Uncharacterized protein n=1 Tax=Glossina pallidipes TaxID=7398 RepID=A0A1B0A2X1_GLOPL
MKYLIIQIDGRVQQQLANVQEFKATETMRISYKKRFHLIYLQSKRTLLADLTLENELMIRENERSRVDRDSIPEHRVNHKRSSKLFEASTVRNRPGKRNDTTNFSGTAPSSTL